MRHPLALVALVALAGSSSLALAQGGYDFSEVTDIARAMVRGDNVPNPVPGFELLIVQDGRTVYRRAFGAWTLGQVAAADSATKTISGAVIMSLTESPTANFSLDTTVGEHFVGLPADKAGITMRQAFSHTSGIGSASTALALPTITLQQSAATILSRPLQHAPGAAFSYDGFDMHVAGAVAERASGQAWIDLFQQRIAGPLGLTQTRYALASDTNPRIAGGCESTAPEMATFMEMLRRGGVHNGQRVLRQASVDAMFTRQTPIDVPVLNSPIPGEHADYGVGVWLDGRNSAGTLTSAVAAGARGMTAWIDFDDRTVGVFCTDLTLSGDVQPTLYVLRQAVEDAIRAGPSCDRIDFNRDGLFPDDQDLVDFLSVLAGGTCSTGEDCEDIDFDNNDLFPDENDLINFLRVLAGGRCLQS